MMVRKSRTDPNGRLGEVMFRSGEVHALIVLLRSMAVQSAVPSFFKATDLLKRPP